jgi:hypothetical protein
MAGRERSYFLVTLRREDALLGVSDEPSLTVLSGPKDSLRGDQGGSTEWPANLPRGVSN